MSHFLYAMQAEVGQSPNFLKIGHTNNPNFRLSSHQVSNPFRLSYGGLWRLNTKADALRMEALVHSHFEQQHIRGEWFDVGVMDVDALLKANMAGEPITATFDGSEPPHLYVTPKKDTTFESPQNFAWRTGKKLEVIQLCIEFGMPRHREFVIIYDALLWMHQTAKSTGRVLSVPDSAWPGGPPKDIDAEWERYEQEKHWPLKKRTPVVLILRTPFPREAARALIDRVKGTERHKLSELVTTLTDEFAFARSHMTNIVRKIEKMSDEQVRKLLK